MSIFLLVTIVCALGVVGYVLARSRVNGLETESSVSYHSRPGYHGMHMAIATVLPALLILAIWAISSQIIISNVVKASVSQEVLGDSAAREGLTMGIISSISHGLSLLNASELQEAAGGIDAARPLLAAKGVAIATDASDPMVEAAFHYNSLQQTSTFWRSVVVILAALICGGWAWTQLGARVKARNRVEGVILGLLILASSIAILTTIGIVLSMVRETGRFFASVPPLEFFFGTVWDPRFAAAGATESAGQFGLLPLLAGTLYIALVAMLVAVPIGLFAAVYMAEYAGPKLRSVAKPLLEVLAGIPTIVYGFFAVVTVGPFLRDLSAQIAGIFTGSASSFIQAQSVLTAGAVMGIMLIPFVSSLSDDIITAVPRAMRDGSLGLGATRSETIKRVILPAAIPGIVGALLLTASRAIGETMIVVLAAGVAARLTINPFEPMTTVTVKIVSQLTGDLEFNSPQTLVAFALGITLFVLTLGLNIYALYVVRKYREQYE